MPIEIANGTRYYSNIVSASMWQDVSKSRDEAAINEKLDSELSELLREPSHSIACHKENEKLKAAISLIVEHELWEHDFDFDEKRLKLLTEVIENLEKIQIGYLGNIMSLYIYSKSFREVSKAADAIRQYLSYKEMKPGPQYFYFYYAGAGDFYTDSSKHIEKVLEQIFDDIMRHPDIVTLLATKKTDI